jgi:hypothetical protein
MGNHDAAAVSSSAMAAAARAIAWKFDLHGVVAGSTVTMGGKQLPTVFGHRDVGQTACPGQYLYPRLAELQAMVRSLQGDTSARVFERDLTGDRFADLLSLGSQGLSLATATSAGWRAPRHVGNGWNSGRTIGPGDWTGDGVPDLMRIDTAGRLYLYPGRSDGSWQTPRVIGRGWQALDIVTGGHDWNGDGRPDLLARNSVDKALYLYASDGRGGFGTIKRIGTGWQVMTAVVAIGNLVDGLPALVARRTDGTLVTYRGDGRGGFAGGTTVVGTGWQVMTAILGAGDVNDDGHVDIVARAQNGELRLYPGDGAGRVRGASTIGRGWHIFGSVVSAGRGGRGQDFYAARASDGALLRYVYQGQGDFGRLVATTVPTSTVVESIQPGDWNGDGRADLITRRSNGDLILHAGASAGGFTTGTRIGTGWQVMDQVVGVGDWAGTGRPGLVALDRSAGRILLYASDGRGGFGPTSVIATGTSHVDRVISVGLWSGGRVPDLLTRTVGGDLELRRGNGAGLLGPPSRIGTGWQIYAAIAGVGDLDGDSKPDLVGVRGDGSIVLYSGNSAGGFFGARPYGVVPGSIS